MATSGDFQLTRTYLAGADLSTKQYFAAKLSTTADKTVELCTDGADFIGVIESPGLPTASIDPATQVTSHRDDVTVVWGGMTKVLAGGAITAGDLITVNANGEFITATTGTEVVGRAEETVADTELFSMLIVGLGTAAP